MKNIYDEKRHVSVVLCTYNGAQYLAEQLDSILQQTYPIDELIVQDDGSTDETVNILKRYAKTYPIIKYTVNATNLGYNRNYFSAIAHATCDYVAISDQDDIWEKDKIERQMASIGDNWLSSGFSKPFANDPSIKIHFDDRLPNCTLERMMYIGMTPGHTMLIRKEMIEKIPNLEKWIDYYTYDKLIQMVAAAYEKVQFCPFILVNQRRHLSAATYGKPENYQRSFCNILRTLQRVWGFYRELRPAMRDYFTKTHELIASIAADTQCKKEAEKMALYQSQDTFTAYLKLTVSCIRLRNRIFHTKEKRPLVSLIRAVLFPITCSDYFRYKSAKYGWKHSSKAIK